jgi:hypothetical protein
LRIAKHEAEKGWFAVPVPYSKERARAAQNVKLPLITTILLAIVCLGGLIFYGVGAAGFFLIMGAAFPYVLMGTLFEYLKFYRIDALRGALDDETRARIEKAFENTKEFTIKEYLSYSDWKKQIRLHQKLNGRDTRSLEEELQKAGVFNPHNAYYLKGKTLEEGLTLAVWQSRHDRDEAILRATEATYTQATAQAATAPDPQKRKEFERQREGAEQELRRLTGDRKERTERLPAFNGECVIRSLNGEIEQMVLKVEAGDYSVRLEDVRKDSGETKRATIRSDGDPFTLGDWGDGFTLDDTELVVKRRGSEREERKPLW